MYLIFEGKTEYFYICFGAQINRLNFGFEIRKYSRTLVARTPWIVRTHSSVPANSLYLM